MLTNTGSDRVRSVRALSRRAVREREGLFLAEGPQAVGEVVAHRPDTVQDLYFEAQPGTGQPGVRLCLEVEVLNRVRAVRHDLANSLRTLGQEQTLAFTHSAPTQRPHRPDPVGTGIGQHLMLRTAGRRTGAARWL